MTKKLLLLISALFLSNAAVMAMDLVEQIKDRTPLNSTEKAIYRTLKGTGADKDKLATEIRLFASVNSPFAAKDKLLDILNRQESILQKELYDRKLESWVSSAVRSLPVWLTAGLGKVLMDRASDIGINYFDLRIAEVRAIYGESKWHRYDYPGAFSEAVNVGKGAIVTGMALLYFAAPALGAYKLYYYWTYVNSRQGEILLIDKIKTTLEEIFSEQ